MIKLQQLISKTTQAVDDYQMIQPNDKIAVGVSGGKDSLTLLYTLHGLKRFYKHKFDLVAITVSMGYEHIDLSEVRTLCESLNIPYHVVPTQIGQIVFEERQEKNPCSLCAKMRRGALNAKAKELGVTRIALGHHKEDVIETAFMSMFFEGRYYCFPPVTYMDKSSLYAIRPLIYTKESSIKAFSKAYELPIVKSPCPANEKTAREDMKQLIKEQSKRYPGLPDRLFHAIQTSQIEGWNLNNLDKKEI